VHTRIARVDVKAGDVIDFVVDCRAEQTYDSFTWVQIIERIDDSKPPKVLAVWDANKQFSGGHKAKTDQLSPWEQYAQALLLSNEFLFVD
jgi:hypothetical protein